MRVGSDVVCSLRVIGADPGPGTRRRKPVRRISHYGNRGVLIRHAGEPKAGQKTTKGRPDQNFPLGAWPDLQRFTGPLRPCPQTGLQTSEFGPRLKEGPRGSSVQGGFPKVSTGVGKQLAWFTIS